MLWVNLVTVTAATVSIVTESPSDDVLERKPYNKGASIMTKVMQRNIFGHAFFEMFILFCIIFAGQGIFVENYTDECFNYSKT